MKSSPRIKRMQRRQRRKPHASPIMLTSLMDIFTVLVVFLLATSSSGQPLPSSQNIQLPQSTATTLPKTTIVVQISDEHIVVQGQQIASVKDVLASNKADIPALVKELEYRNHILEVTTGKKTTEPRKITIMGDKSIPFALLKKAMMSCTQTVYTKISFAILMKAESA